MSSHRMAVAQGPVGVARPAMQSWRKKLVLEMTMSAFRLPFSGSDHGGKRKEEMHGVW